MTGLVNSHQFVGIINIVLLYNKLLNLFIILVTEFDSENARDCTTLSSARVARSVLLNGVCRFTSLGGGMAGKTTFSFSAVSLALVRFPNAVTS